jgi:hypothetical protein
MDFPSSNDDFDRDITNDFSGAPSPMLMAFNEIHESFIALISVGFTETQALKFLAFCSIYDGDF